MWNVLGGVSIETAPFCVMCIVNVTPDSFYDGGRHATSDAALAHGLSLAAHGARILDVGGESTRPYAEEVSASEELERVVPVIRGLKQALGEAAENSSAGDCALSAHHISVDTYKAEVAAAALEAGAAIVNDVSACRFDPALKDVLAEKKPGYVLMHSLAKPATMQQNPRYEDVVDEVRRFFESTLDKLVAAGLPEDRIVLDPGIGFGKTMAHNLELVANVDRFAGFGRPLLMGLSNKSVWEKLLGAGVHERETATQAATAISWAAGCAIHRVHDVERTIQTLRVAEAVKQARRNGEK
ncbi:MAG: dihydropteroate synthase [Oceanidesulfovibrio sp.]